MFLFFGFLRWFFVIFFLNLLLERNFIIYWWGIQLFCKYFCFSFLFQCEFFGYFYRLTHFRVTCFVRAFQSHRYINIFFSVDDELIWNLRLLLLKQDYFIYYRVYQTGEINFFQKVIFRYQFIYHYPVYTIKKAFFRITMIEKNSPKRTHDEI